MNIGQVSNELEHLLNRINATLDDHARLDLRESLCDLIESMPWDAEYNAIRKIADEAFDDLGDSINASVLERMRRRGKDLARYAETISAVTNRAEQDIELLRLKHIQAITVSAKEIADSVHSIQSSLQAKNLVGASEGAEQALQLVLNLIGDLSKQK